MQPILLPLLLAAAGQPATQPPVREPVSSYRIGLQALGAALRISGTGTFPPLEKPAENFDFYLSALIPEPRFSLRCGRRPLPIAAITSVPEGGDRKWALRTAVPCAAGEVVRLEFRYAVDNLKAPQMRTSETYSFAGGGGELWYPQRSFGERQVGRIVIDVPQGFLAIATGSLERQSRSGGRRRFRYRADSPAKLAFAYGPYSQARFGGAYPVRVLTSEHQEQAGELVRSLAPLTASLASSFGPAPFTTFSLVEVPFGGEVLGTSEYGMIFAPAARMRGAFDAPYWAHELGHQWWGNLVRAASGTPGATLLTEGLAQYGGLIAIESTQGIAAGRAFRLGTIGPNPVSSIESYRSLVRAGSDRAPVFLPRNQDEILLAHRLATSKGALTLRYFASLIGEARFHNILRRFLATKAGGRTSWTELEDSIHRATEGRYRWFFEQWLHRAGAPQIAVSYCVEGRTLRGEVRQEGTPFRLLIPVEIAGTASAVRKTVEAADATSRFTLTTEAPADSLIVDPDALIPTMSPTAVTRQAACSGL